MNSYRGPTPRGSSYDLKAVLNMYRRRLLIFLAIAAPLCALVVAAAYLVRPVYASRAQIRLDPNQKVGLDVNAIMGGLPDSAQIDTEVSVMKSRDVATGVVQQLHLESDPEFNGRPKQSESASRAALAPNQAQAANLQRTLARLQSRVKVSREGATYIVNVDASSHDPVKASQIANAMAEQYIAVSQRQKIAAAIAQQAALGGRANDLQKQAEDASAAVARYRVGAGIVEANAAGAAGGTVTDQEASTLAAQLSMAQAEAAAAEAKAKAAKDQALKLGSDSISEVLTSPVIISLRTQRAEILRDQAHITSQYGPKHPDVIRVQNQLNQVDNQIRNEAQRIIDGIENDARAEKAKAEAIQARLNSVKGRQALNARAQVEADALQRKATTLTNIANTTTEVAQRASEQAQIGQSQGKIEALAGIPASPSFPNKPVFAFVGILLGFFAGSAVILVMEAFDSSIRAVDDIEQNLGVRCLGSMPLLPKGYRIAGKQGKPGWDYAMDHPLSGFAESLRTLRKALKLGRADPQIITIASALPNEGKSTTAVSLALVMGMSGDRVLLVDGDIRKNAVRRLLKETPQAGLVEVLEGKVSIDAAIVRDVLGQIDILPLIQTHDTTKDLFDGVAMRELLAKMRLRYDKIIIDTPPLFAIADARTLAALSDAVLLVVRWNKTPTNAIRAAIDQLTSDQSKLTGVFMTMVDLNARAKLGDGSSNYYYSSYKDYYIS